jgi:type II secretory pathway component PulF
MAKALPTEMQAVPSGGSPYSVGVGAADVWDRLRPGLAVHAHLLVHEVLPLALAAFALWKLALLIIYLPPLTHMRDAVALYTPGISVGTRRAAAGRFSHVLQLMLRAAVPLGDAVAEAARATGNSILQRAVLAKAPALERGVPLREVLRDSGVFRPSEVSLIATAEETGTLEGAAADLAARARQDREDYISKAKYGGCAWGCLTSALLVLVAALIGYIGILHMYEQFYQWLMSP